MERIEGTFDWARRLIAGGPQRHTRALAWVIAAAATLAIQGCGSDEEPLAPQVEEFNQESGLHLQYLASRDLQYTIAIPPTYSPDTPTPIILALHPTSEATEYFGAAFLNSFIGPAFQELNAVMVAPDATRGTWVDSNSEADLLALWSALRANYNIDANRTLITGYDIGGDGTWYMAARHQDKFRAAIPVAANVPVDVLDVEWSIPIFIIHSRTDEVYPYAAAENAYYDLREKGVAAEMIAIENFTHANMPDYLEPLHDTVAWVKGLWGIP